MKKKSKVKFSNPTIKYWEHTFKMAKAKVRIRKPGWWKVGRDAR